jgi:hypothetical protein
MNHVRGDPRRRIGQDVRAHARARRARPDCADRGSTRLPRSQRLGEDHHHPDPARAAAGRCRLRSAARRRPVARHHDTAPPIGVRARRRDPVAQLDRRRCHRPARPAPRRAQQAAPRRAARALRSRPAQEGSRVLQGQPAEGGAGRRPRLRCGAAHPRRADVRPRPVHGRGLPPGDPRGAAARRPYGPALQPHPLRGGGAVRPGHHHPRRAGRRDRHTRPDAAPHPHLDRGQPRRSGGRAGNDARRA